MRDETSHYSCALPCPFPWDGWQLFYNQCNIPKGPPQGCTPLPQFLTWNRGQSPMTVTVIRSSSLFPSFSHSPLLYPLHIFHSFSCQDWSGAPWRKERWTLAETLPIHNHGIRAQPPSHVVQGTISDNLAKHYLSSISKNMPLRTRDASFGIVLSQAVNPFSESLGAVGLDKCPSQTPTMATEIGRQDPCSMRFLTEPSHLFSTQRRVQSQP